MTTHWPVWRSNRNCDCWIPALGQRGVRSGTGAGCRPGSANSNSSRPSASVHRGRVGHSRLPRRDGQAADVRLDDSAVGDLQSVVDDQVVHPAHPGEHVGAHLAVLRVIGHTRSAARRSRSVSDSVCASAIFGVVRPASGSKPCTPRYVASTRNDDSMAASAMGPTSASGGCAHATGQIDLRRVGGVGAGIGQHLEDADGVRHHGDRRPVPQPAGELGGGGARADRNRHAVLDACPPPPRRSPPSRRAVAAPSPTTPVLPRGCAGHRAAVHLAQQVLRIAGASRSRRHRHLGHVEVRRPGRRHGPRRRRSTPAESRGGVQRRAWERTISNRLS